ncbi:MAG: hypothetical protein FJZ01_11890, partial [Candidatus Sericytochromatia bacterium]|nr:hypothetical protein [Candidatus Tanganyikabacteria bacterium]
MPKTVHQLAQQANLKLREAITLLNDLDCKTVDGRPVSGNFNRLSDEVVEKVLARFAPPSTVQDREEPAAPAGPTTISAPAAHVIVTPAPRPVRQDTRGPQPGQRPAAAAG